MTYLIFGINLRDLHTGIWRNYLFSWRYYKESVKAATFYFRDPAENLHMSTKIRAKSASAFIFSTNNCMLKKASMFIGLAWGFINFQNVDEIFHVCAETIGFFFPRISVFSSHARKKKRGKKCARKSKARKNRKTARKKRVFCQTFEKCE